MMIAEQELCVDCNKSGVKGTKDGGYINWAFPKYIYQKDKRIFLHCHYSPLLVDSADHTIFAAFGESTEEKSPETLLVAQ